MNPKTVLARALAAGGILFGIMAVVFFVIAVFLIVPALAIWSLNTLFQLNIPYAWRTFLAVFLLLAILKHRDGGRTEKK